MNEPRDEIDILTEENQIIFQGAESRVKEGRFCGKPAVFKNRFVKKYRILQLDEQITKERMRNEARILLKCRQSGLPVPCLYHVDTETRTLVLEKLEGVTLKERLIELEERNDFQTIRELLRLLGSLFAELHKIHVIHGDLTTSNIVMRGDDIFLIDFGLSVISEKSEEKAVDLYVLERSFQSTHHSLQSEYPVLLESYSHSMNKKTSAQIMSKYREVQMRGRKRTMVG